MPRKTPVRELQKEEPVIGSPLRRSSRLNNSSPVPTKVISRRNSASETSTSTPVVTRSRRSSFSQEIQPGEDPQADKKKTTSTVRTRRSSLTQSNDAQTPVETTAKTRARSSSKESDQVPEVKKATGRRRSITEDSENGQDASKKITRSRSSSATKKNENADVPASTPIKKSSPPSTTDVLESIEEANKEVESPSGTPSKKYKRRVTEVSKIDFDLSIINEASLTDEELSPHKKSALMDKSEDQPKKSSNEKDVLETAKSEDTSEKVDTEETIKISSKNEPDVDSEVTKEGSPDKKNYVSEKLDLTVSESSFNLQLSPLENGDQNKSVANNKENISPKESVCEPMEVDEVFEESSPVKKKILKSPKVSANIEINEVDKKIQVAAEITDKMAEFLSEKILANSPKNKQGKTDGKNEKNLSLKESDNVNDTKNAEGEVSEQVEKNSVSMTEGEVVEESKLVQDLSRELPESEKKVEETHEASLTKNKSELNKSTEIRIEEQSTDKESLNVSSSTKIEKSTQVCEPIESVKSSPSKENHESDVMDNATEKISTEPSGDHLVKDAAEEKSPRKTPSKAASIKRKSDSFQEQTELTEPAVSKDSSTSPKVASIKRKSDSFQEPAVSKDSSTSPKVPSIKRKSDSFQEKTAPRESEPSKDSNISETAVTVTNDEPIVEPEEPSTVEEKTSLNKDREEEIEKDPSEKSCTEEQVVNSEESSSDTDNIPSVILKEKEHIIVSSQNGSKVPRQIKIEEIVSVSESCTDEDLDLEVKTINENKAASPGKRSRKENWVSLCDSDSSDETFTPQKETSVDKLDSKYSIATHGKTQKEKNRSESSSEVVELTDGEDSNEVFDEPSGKDDTEAVNQTITAEPEENKIKKEKKDLNLSTSSLKKRPSDRRSITLQETIKAGDDPEEKLSGHIHKVVDLFCASIKNKSDLSINVSMEYAEHVSDSEDESGNIDVVNISLTASDFNEVVVETEKGSKRRKVCRVSDADVKSPEKPPTNENEVELTSDSPHEISQNSSIINEGEKTGSAKKRKKRKSDALQSENIAVKTSPKVSFSTDTEQKSKSPKKGKKRRSTGDLSASENELTEQREQKTSPVKKPVPLTPFKSSKEMQPEDSSESFEETSEDEENNESNISSYNLFSASFEDSDVNDLSWRPDEDVDSDSSDSEINISDVEEEEDVTDLQDELPTVLTTKERRKINSRSSSEETSPGRKMKKIPRRKSTSFAEDATQDPVKETEDKVNKNKKRKLFRPSTAHNLSQAFASSETEEKPTLEQTASADKIVKQSKDPKLGQKKLKSKSKKSKQTFSSESIECILPETSEVQEKPVKISRKRRHPSASSVNSEEPTKIVVDNTYVTTKRKMKKVNKKHVLPNTIEPSAGNIKNSKRLRMKPSTKMNSGWDVTTM
ncbi:hypothetical protein Zmor_007074 [Zophobas morio]|uniref:Uncharacterized protein n=1 Tax=Zophobas morio TaxID=2755281 RepID=A0AA38J194_9CUCU|nr:hypothetical protein Zmor_007074 [Zophobas morio]